MALTGKRILITCGAGFIGSHLAERLVDANEIAIYDSLQRNAIRFTTLAEHPNVRVIQGDVMELDDVRRAMRGCQVVVHAAAVAGIYSVVKNSLSTMQVNLFGTDRVLQAARDVELQCLLHFSTSEVYGPFIHNGKEDGLSTIGPVGETRWVYAASKLASEHLAHAYAKEYGLPIVTVRPFNVYGPRQVGEGALRGMILRALARQPLILYNDGTQIRAWCYVDDFVDGLVRCLETPSAHGHVFNLGNPQGTITNLELAHMVLRLTSSDSSIVHQEHPGPEVEVRVPSIRKATDLLGFAPQVTLEEGIRRTIPWYREHLDAAQT